MTESWDERKKALEEEYFRKKEQEAIEKLRAKRAAAEADAAAPRCPKCDGILKEFAYEGVQLDQCTACNGIWLDAGELELLTQKEDSGGWLRRLFQGAKDE